MPLQELICTSKLRPKYPQRGTGIEKLFSGTKQTTAHEVLPSFSVGQLPSQVHFSRQRNVGNLVSQVIIP